MSVTAFRERTSLLRKYFLRYRKPMIFGFITLVLVDLLEILPPILLKEAVDSIVEQHPYVEILKFAAIYLGVLIAQGFCRWGWRIFLIRSSMLAGRDLRSDFTAHLFGLPASFYDKNRVGDLMSLANSDTESIRQFLGPGLLTFADSLFYLATVPVAMYFLSPELTFLALAPIPFIPFLVLKMENAVHDRYKSSQDQFSTLSAMAQENLNGIRVVKAFAREDIQYSRFRAIGEEYVRLNLRLARIQSAFGPLMDFFASLGIVILLWFGGASVMTGAITLGTFVAFQRYIQKMIWPMMALGLSASSYQRSLASSSRLKEVFNQNTSIKLHDHPRKPEGGVKGRIEIRNLTFTFPGAEKPAIRNLSLTIEAGTRVAFVGRIGSGKSALLSLLPRIYPAPAETIFLDGIPIEEWPIEDLRSEIGFVSQDVFLFSESVIENIAFGFENRNDPSREVYVQEAAWIASIDDEIRSLPRGYETLLGERGVNLSGGQKQRISLARAIMTHPSILVLDDALSAVDVKTEAMILSRLRNRSGKNTELIAAHRVSTARDADQIYVFEQGEMVEVGKHDELIRNSNGIYARFFEEQRLKEDLETYMLKVDEEFR